MSSYRSSKRSLLLIVIPIVVAAVVLGALYYMRRPQPTPAMRGYALAGELGCFACHGPGGTGGVPNPLSDDKLIPAWDGGTAMMYVQSEDEIREWILFGHPKRLEEEEHEEHAHHGDSLETDQLTPPTLPVEMPAFEGLISERELEDLVAYFKSVAVFHPLPPGAARGYQVAKEAGCFGCHGPGGRVGMKNPGSFKGYIPPWNGPDFGELVRNDDELRAWIRDGTIERFQEHPLARVFLERQVIRMPAYRDVLNDRDVEAIVTYINWIRQPPKPVVDSDLIRDLIEDETKKKED